MPLWSKKKSDLNGSLFVCMLYGVGSLPLYSCWWLGGDVVTDAVDALDLTDDAVGDIGEEVVGQVCPVGCHGVGGGDGAQGYGILVGALIAHDAY